MGKIVRCTHPVEDFYAATTAEDGTQFGPMFECRICGRQRVPKTHEAPDDVGVVEGL